ncbi:MAG: class II aldolase/adducin family protein [Roseiarcus sp.]|jgi:L-fuculose-phosphate aldolase
MNADEFALRRAIIEACLTMNARGFNQGKSGNVSARFGENILITPTSLPYEQMQPEDLAQMPIKGEYGSWSGPYAPSTEWRFHLDIVRARPDVGAVVHTHSLYATALGICGREIPAIHYMIATCGGPTVRLAPYATFGTKELSDHALKALEGRNACLLANHGAIAVGSDLRRALALAEELENLARQYYLALQLGGAHILPDDEVATVKERMKNYGIARATPAAVE